MSENDIAVVGMSCVFPGAVDLDQYWSNMMNGVDSITRPPQDRLNGGLNFEQPLVPCLDKVCTPTIYGGFIPPEVRVDPLRYGLLPKNVLEGDPDQFLAVSVIDGALKDAGFDEKSPIRERCDVIVGRGGYLTNKMAEGYLHAELFPHLLLYLRQQFPQWSERQFNDFAQQMFDRMPPLSGADGMTTAMPNLVASRAANRLNLRGAAYCVDAACASSLLAIEHAVLRLRVGQCDAAVVCGIHLVQLASFWGVFHQMGAISKSNCLRPFDRRADGLLAGEGGGAVALKRFEDARRDGDRIYAILKGIGSSSDGRGAAILNPLSEGQVLALKRAYHDAQIDPASIGYVEAHGTGTEIGDAVEIHTLKTFFGERNSAVPTRALGSVKSMIGHLMPAAGVASFIRTVLALSNKILPPSLNCEEPHPALSNSQFYVNRRSRAWVHQSNGAPRRAGVNAFGFGGINVHAILEELPEETSQNWSRPYHLPVKRETELFAWAADSPELLISQLRQVAVALASDLGPTLAELSAAVLRSVDQSRPCKLALLVADLEQLRNALLKCITQLSQSELEFAGDRDVFFAPAAAANLGRVAAVFPGMSYPGLGGPTAEHLMTLSLHFPEVRRVLDKIENRGGNPDDMVPTSLMFSPPETLPEESQTALRRRIMSPQLSEMRVGAADLRPSERNIAIAALAIANCANWTMLQTLSVAIDCVVGQSIGDLGATCAAGIINIDHVMPGFWIALATAPPYLGNSQLAVVLASEEQLKPFLAEAPQSCIALHIAPHVQVIGGPADQLEQLITKVKSARWFAQQLPYPPIHTADCSYLDEVMARGMDAGYNHFHEARLQIYSCVTASEYPREKEQIRGMALEMLNRPVRYWQTLRRMYDDGVRIFIETGNGGLAGTQQSTLPGAQAVVACLDQETIDPLTQLHRLCAILLTSGVSLDLNRLHMHRKLRQLDLKDDGLGVASKNIGMPLPLKMTMFPFGREVLESGRQMLRARSNTLTGEASPPACVENSAITSTIAETSGQLAEPPVPLHTPAGVTSDIEVDQTVIAQHQNSVRYEEQAEVESLDLPHRPFHGEIKEFVPGERIVIERVLDLDRDLFLRDHVFIPAQDYKPVEECMPLFPMAAMVEVMAETAEILAPELSVIGVEQMQAVRWIAFRDQKMVTIRIEARVVPIDSQKDVVAVHTELSSNGESNATALVLLGPAFEETLQVSFSPRDGSRSWAYTADEIYRDRHAFHGPRLQCVTKTGSAGALGADGVLTVLPIDDWFVDDPRPQFIFDIATLDGVAQTLGGWVRGYGKFSVPMGFQKMERYQDTPPFGTEAVIRLELMKGDENSRIYVFDIEVQNGQGQVWMRFIGFRMWTFDWTVRGIEAMRQPDKVFLSVRLEPNGLPTDAVVTSVCGEHIPGGNFDWLGRLCLTHSEIDCFDRLESPRRKRQWLFGRLAAKDAVRMWMKQQYGIEFLHPLTFAILNDELGCPLVQMLFDLPTPPFITISHAGDRSFAAAAASPIGIDAEPNDRSVEEILSHFAQLAEQQILAAFEDESNAALRLWCAKEAVGKVRGTGLGGAPKDFELIDFEADGRLLVHHHPSADRYVVTSTLVDGILLAYVCSPLDEVALVEATDAREYSQDSQS